MNTKSGLDEIALGLGRKATFSEDSDGDVPSLLVREGVEEGEKRRLRKILMEMSPLC